MPLVFVTPSDYSYDVEIGGVGTLGGSARGGILVERAAETMVELQDAKGRPLSGKKLEDAAHSFADRHGYVSVKSLKNVDEEKLRVEAGALPRGKTIEEISREVAERELGRLEEHSEAPEAPPLVPADLPPQETSTFPEPPGAEPSR